MSFREISLLLNVPMGTVQWKYYTSLYTLRLLLGNISMFIIGILIFIKGNITNREMQETNLSNDISPNDEIMNENIEQSKNETSPSAESNIDYSNLTDSIIQKELIEIEKPREEKYEDTNSNIGILSFTGIFLFFTIIFTIIFVKHQQKAHKNVSK